MRLPLLILSSFFIPLALTALASAQPSTPPKMLVIDYAMGYPEENAGVMSIFTEAGFEAHYRQYYPALVEQDALDYDAIVLMGGGDPGMSYQDADLAINFVLRGKTLVLAMPADSEYGGAGRTNAGTHDRHMFNRLLNRLSIKLYAVAPPVEGGAALTPVVAYETVPGHRVGRGVASPIRLRAGTRIVVGEGAEPLLVEPEVVPETNILTEQPAPSPPEPQVKMVKRRIRIQITDALPDEDVELLLRGDQTVSGHIGYVSNRASRPVNWTTDRMKGRVVSVTSDTMKVRMSGNLWGSDFAVFGIPVPVVAVAFVERAFPEEIETDKRETQVLDRVREAPGRLTVMALSRGDRLGKGFVLVADRQALNTLSQPALPLSLYGEDTPDRRQVGTWLIQVAAYLRTLMDDPEAWAPENPYPEARVPGIGQPDFPINQIEMMPRLPGKVTVTVNRIRPSDLMGDAPEIAAAPPVRGIWEFVPRANAYLDTLLNVLTANDFNFLWTVAPAEGFTANDSAQASQASRFTTWGRQVTDHLAGAGVQWFAGISKPDETDMRYEPAVDARGNRVGQPSLFDLAYWEDHILAPARQIARFSRSTHSLTGIINDWDTHVNRAAGATAMTDVYDDAIFQHYISYAANHGFYRGDAFKAFKKLNRNERFNWLLKSGRLEDYFRMLEDRAALLGRLYREAVDDINPSLRHGSFIRTPKPTWFDLGFWRGVGEGQDSPYIVLAYEDAPLWFDTFLKARGLEVRLVPMILLGLIDEHAYQDVVRRAMARGGYCLERGVWLVRDPDNAQDLSAPQRRNVPRAQAIEALRRAHRTEEPPE